MTTNRDKGAPDFQGGGGGFILKPLSPKKPNSPKPKTHNPAAQVPRALAMDPRPPVFYRFEGLGFIGPVA